MPRKPSISPGLRFGKWTVLCRGKKSRYWLCECDCGTRREVHTSTLVAGKSASCGCFKRRGRNLKKYRGHSNEGSKAHVLYGYKYQAEKRNLLWNLSDEEALEIMSKPCFYCGTVPNVSRRYLDHQPFVCNGMDRVDNDQGYVGENVVPCCTNCNRAKRSMRADSFIEWAKKLSDHQNGLGWKPSMMFLRGRRFNRRQEAARI